MDTITFDKLLLNTAFCCMACDGNIDSKEVELIKSMCSSSPLFLAYNFTDEINSLVNQLNTTGKEFINNYFELLKATSLTEEEELTLIDFAIKTINADEKVEYAEIKFFKVIRHHLKLSDETILGNYQDIEYWLEQDIITENYLVKIKSHYLEIVELPQFDVLKIDDAL